ncbi:MAG: TVP38/TMEM64 family protein [Desulfomonilaceae bacterium]|jgi:uncharacterized membrane protein YdjX (TVP38/TMEM64 family)
MKPVDERDKTQLRLAVGVLIALLTLVIVLLFSGRLGPLWAYLLNIFKSKEALRDFVESWGKAAPLAFIFIQALQVVVAPIPGELTGAVGGFIFGAWPNVVYSTIGLTIGSMGAFIAARIIGMPLVRYFVSENHLKRFHFLTERKGAILAFAFFAIPGFPKDILSYILGMSPMCLGSFFWVSTLGRIPGTIMLSLGGSAIYDQNWALLFILTVLCVLSFVIIFFQRDRIEKWARHRHHKKL